MTGIKSSLSFLLFVSQKLRSSAASSLSVAGIAAGVATLVVVMAVMNGFQMSFKDAIMELTSSHIRVETAYGKEFLKWCDEQKEIRASYPFREEKAFIVGKRGRESAAQIRAVPKDLMSRDLFFAREIGIKTGSFLGNGENADSAEDTIVLGSSLASILGVSTGGEVTLLALSGGNDTALLSQERVFKVSGTFHCGYSVINETCAYVSLEAAKKYFGAGESTIAIKLVHHLRDAKMINKIKTAAKLQGLDVRCQSWREYNSAFFGVLRVEKNMMLILVAFIFVAVSVNIYNAMRREVYTRRDMIAVLAALGGRIDTIRLVFIMRGFLLGLKGAIAGSAAGLCFAVNMKTIFMLPGIITQNPMYMLYAAIPARVQLGETLFIASSALLAPLISSWAASTAVLKLPPQETLRYE